MIQHVLHSILLPKRKNEDRNRQRKSKRVLVVSGAMSATHLQLDHNTEPVEAEFAQHAEHRASHLLQLGLPAHSHPHVRTANCAQKAVGAAHLQRQREHMVEVSAHAQNSTEQGKGKWSSSLTRDQWEDPYRRRNQPYRGVVRTTTRVELVGGGSLSANKADVIRPTLPDQPHQPAAVRDDVRPFRTQLS